jgi:16S rRNA (guanine527-N7)-methyltransferase
VSEWAPRVDLVAPGDLDRFRERHVDDCLRLLSLEDAAGRGPAVDVGSGAGLPGIVLAIARPERLWRLVEPREKRTAFLEEVVRELGLGNVEVVRKTAQQAALDPRLARAHVLAVARAVAPPARSLELLTPLVTPGGIAAVFVGKTGTIPVGAKEWHRGIAVLAADGRR